MNFRIHHQKACAILLIILLTVLGWKGGRAVDHGPLPKVITLSPAAKSFQVFWDRAVSGECAGLLSEVAVPLKSFDSLRLNVLAEMHDRGVCVSRDPMEAFRLFEAASSAQGQDWAPRTAFKLWYGDGVPMDRVEASRQYKRFVLSVSWLPKEAIDNVLKNRHSDRQWPPPLSEALAWLFAMRSDTALYVDWARDLFRGNARYFDGSTIPAMPSTAEFILLGRVGKARGHFALGQEILATSNLVERIREGIRLIQVAARCRYAPAVVAMVHLAEKHQTTTHLDRGDAHAWALVANELGIEVRDVLTWQRRNFSHREIQQGKQRFTKLRFESDCD